MSQTITEAPHFKQSFELLVATVVVAGSMIGSGIFIVSSDTVRNVGSAGWLIALWALTGVIKIITALLEVS